MSQISVGWCTHCIHANAFPGVEDEVILLDDASRNQVIAPSFSSDVLRKNTLSVKQTQIQCLTTTVNCTVLYLASLPLVFNHSILYFGWKKNTTLCLAESPWFSTGAGHQEQQRSQLRNTYLVSRTLGRHQTTREHGQKFTLFTWTWLESF